MLVGQGLTNRQIASTAQSPPTSTDADLGDAEPRLLGPLERVPRIMRAGCGRPFSCCIVMI